jgi:hypothetical protein
VLSDETLRKQYDLHGKDSAVPSSGFGTHKRMGFDVVGRLLTLGRGSRRVLHHDLWWRGLRGLVFAYGCFYYYYGC